jgi:predicted nucleic acid-binding protein
LILDSGAVIALSRADQRALGFLARAREVGAEVLIPVVVVAETVRGGPRDAAVNRVLKAVGTVPAAFERTGRAAGEILGRARSDATIDALVVAETVVRGGGRVLTGDPDDLRRLAGPYSNVVIHPLSSSG